MKLGMEERITLSGIHLLTVRNAESGKLIRQVLYKNLIANVGKAMLANRMAGVGNACVLTYGAVGTSVVPPAVGDTTLGTELDRVALTSISVSGGVVTILSFFGASDGNGVLTEYGIFGDDASAAVNSGTLVSHVVIGQTKTNLITLTIESKITVA